MDTNTNDQKLKACNVITKGVAEKLDPYVVILKILTIYSGEQQDTMLTLRKVALRLIKYQISLLYFLELPVIWWCRCSPLSGTW